MDETLKRTLAEMGPGRVRFDRSMAHHTTLRVGGEAEVFYEVCTQKELSRVVAFLRAEAVPYTVVGGGSNLLVSDDGMEGVAIALRGDLAALGADHAQDRRIRAGGGHPLADLLSRCRRGGFGGLEFLSGIPATVGGAVTMNAGAFGREIGERVVEIRIVDEGGEVIVKDRSQLLFSYRALALAPGQTIFQVLLEMDQEEPRVIAGRMAAYLKRRRGSQPLDYPSAGCVFKNPAHHPAGRLIEEAGLKGKRIGGAVISPKHANWIVNVGNATAKDILALIALAKETVMKHTGIALETEIRIVGR